MRRAGFLAFLPLILAAACADLPVDSQGAGSSGAPEASTAPVKTDATITSTLLDVLEHKDKAKVDLSQSQGTPEGDILLVGSPIGYNLRARYLNVGVPIAEGLSRDTDPAFRQQLVTLARWDRDSETRAAAMLTVARQQELGDVQIFNEALIHLDPAVRFGALEALQVWGHPTQAMPLLAGAADKDTEPILRVYASAALARLGDPSGLIRLRAFLENPSWLVRAMAARYLGETGTAEDYDHLVSRIGSEQLNDFVVAEDAIGALKLYPKRKQAAEQAVSNQELRDKPTAPYPPADRGNIPDPVNTTYQLEPLVIKAPRTRLTADMPIDPQIDAQLLRLLQQRVDARPDAQATLDASVGNLVKLSTLDGYNLKVRYTEVGFLLTEGLAGTTDFQLLSELEKAARLAQNPQTRAAALVALAYTRNLQYVSLFQSALQDQNVTVRFGALESMLLLGDPSVQFQIANSAHNDLSLPIQVYAAAGLWRMGDVFGREQLRIFSTHQDWLVRAMATHYLGEMGEATDYRKLFQQLPTEAVPAVKAELCSALLNLRKYKDQ